MQTNRSRVARALGFTLIEVLVSVAVIALLISILLPSLARVRAQSQSSVCLSNLKQIGTGLTMYIGQHRDRYPQHSSPSSMVPRKRWPDYLWRTMVSTDIYRCPSLSDEQKKGFLIAFAHTVNQTTAAVGPQTKYHGGYGYNFQYLGNARFFTGAAFLGWMPEDYKKPYFAQVTNIRQPAMTIAVADTTGSRRGLATNTLSAAYALDPPLGSVDLGSKGSRRNVPTQNDWYEGPTSPGPEELWRSAPDRRHLGKPNVTFVDGHAERMDGDELDGRKNGASGDNRYYNGRFDSRVR